MQTASNIQHTVTLWMYLSIVFAWPRTLMFCHTRGGLFGGRPFFGRRETEAWRRTNLTSHFCVIIYIHTIYTYIYIYIYLYHIYKYTYVYTHWFIHFYTIYTYVYIYIYCRHVEMKYKHTHIYIYICTEYCHSHTFCQFHKENRQALNLLTW